MPAEGNGLGGQAPGQPDRGHRSGSHKFERTLFKAPAMGPQGHHEEAEATAAAKACLLGHDSLTSELSQQGSKQETHPVRSMIRLEGQCQLLKYGRAQMTLAEICCSLRHQLQAAEQHHTGWALHACTAHASDLLCPEKASMSSLYGCSWQSHIQHHIAGWLQASDGCRRKNACFCLCTSFRSSAYRA